MNRYKPQDEWSKIIASQAEANKQIEADQRMRQAHTKNAYKAELDYLCTFKPQRVSEEREVVNRDRNDIQAAQEWYREDQIRKQQEKSKWQNNLASSYAKQQENHQSVRQQEITQKLELDRAATERAAMAAIRQKELEQQKKDIQVQQANATIEHKRKIQDQKKQEELRVKQMEIKQVNDYAEKEAQRLSERREYYQKLDQDRTKRQLVYNHTTADLALQRRGELNQWINKREEEHNQRIDQKFNIEAQRKAQAFQSHGDILRLQIQEKEEKKRQDLMADKQRNAQERNRMQAANIDHTNMQIAARQADKINYRNQLTNQFEINEKRRLEQYKLTEAERRLNRNNMDENQVRRDAGLMAIGNDHQNSTLDNKILSPRNYPVESQSDNFGQHRRVVSQTDAVPPSNRQFQQKLAAIRASDQTSRNSGRSGSISQISGTGRYAAKKHDVTNPVTGGPLTNRF